MLKFMFITNQSDIAAFVHAQGVQRIFLDLEILGKKERQGHLNTVISCHTMDDVKRVRQAVPKAELLVRINPLNPSSTEEINTVIKSGADLIMLPMFHTDEEVFTVAQMIDGRVPLIPLVETPAAVLGLPEVIELPGVTEIYIGLNDLSLALQFKFMFQPLANGMLEKMARILRAKGMPFGFGGIARVGQGKLAAELIMTEHLRLGSSCVILSRAFHGNASHLEELTQNIDFGAEIKRLREIEANLAKREQPQIDGDFKHLVDTIDSIV